MNPIVLFLLCFLSNFLSSLGRQFGGVKVYTLGDKILWEKCANISIESIKSSPHIIKAIKDTHAALSAFRIEMKFGRAIAAPQVGYQLRMIAMNLNGTEHTLFNPEIIEKSADTFTMWDDCLSFPNLMCCIRRYKSISVRFVNKHGETVTWKHCDQALSELLQHEIDHLNGVLAVDNAEKPSAIGLDKTCPAIVLRSDWLRDKSYYNSLVDFSY